jgi:DNA-binding transcriptional LysR family regulator
MELRQLKYFVAVAEELHFRRAAERLHIAQPAISKQLLNLERELGVQLFYRDKRQVRLTNAGRLFLEEAKKVLEHTERAMEVASSAAKGEIGQLTVGFVSPATLTILPRTIKVFQEHYPGVGLELCRLTTAEQIEALHDGRIQVGFAREPVLYEGDTLDSKIVLREPLVVAMPEAHPFSTEPQLSLSRLANEPFMMFSRPGEPGLYEKYMQVFRSAGFTPKKVVKDTPHIQAILGFVAEGLGLMLMPACLQKLGRSGVVFRKLQDPSPEVDLVAIWRRGDNLPVLQNFLGVIDEVSRSYSAD